jgi:Fe-S oxidoreductase
VFFPDTFVRYYEPRVGLAACRVLQRLGCDTYSNLEELDCWDSIPTPPLEEHFPGLRCCGRPLISNGMLDQAIRCATANLQWLHPLAAEGEPIVACEPSCLLTIKDDYPALVRGELRQKAETVAAACRTFEEFADDLLEKGRVRLRPGPKRILVQAHCHQRALTGTGPLLRLLRRIPGAEVIDLDAGCCGLAGSFGYEKEHYEVSRLVGEQRLFPALRQAAPEDVIVAPGFSCRLQIKHFTGRDAVHPTQLLHALLDHVDQGP